MVCAGFCHKACKWSWPQKQYPSDAGDKINLFSDPGCPERTKQSFLCWQWYCLSVKSSIRPLYANKTSLHFVLGGCGGLRCYRTICTFKTCNIAILLKSTCGIVTITIKKHLHTYTLTHTQTHAHSHTRARVCECAQRWAYIMRFYSNERHTSCVFVTGVYKLHDKERARWHIELVQ